LKTEIKLMIKLLLIPLKPLRKLKLVLSALLLLQTRKELRNSNLNKCGDHQTELSETF